MPPDYLIQTLSFASIDYQNPFLQKMHKDADDTQLIAKLRQFGQIIPLLVLEKLNGTYQLLANFTHFEALKLLRVEHAICRLLPHSIDPFYCYAMQVLHGWDELQVSPILQAHLLQQAQRDCTTTELLSILSLMGHKPHQHVADELIAVLSLSNEAQLNLHRGILAAKSGKLMQRLSHQDQDSVVKFLRIYRPGGSKQYKLLEMLTELVLRLNTPAASLLQKWMPTGQEEKVDNSPQQMHNLLRELAESCWPEKTRMKEQFRRFASLLVLPQNVSLSPSPSFEDESCTLSLRFSTSEELQNKWEKIRSLLMNKE